MEYFERIVDISTNETIERPYSKKEADEVIKAIASFELAIAEKESKEIQRRNLLEKLGITEEEAKLLLL